MSEGGCCTYDLVPTVGFLLDVSLTFSLESFSVHTGAGTLYLEKLCTRSVPQRCFNTVLLSQD